MLSTLQRKVNSEMPKLRASFEASRPRAHPVRSEGMGEEFPLSPSARAFADFLLHRFYVNPEN
jgi:hypothetical protein